MAAAIVFMFFLHITKGFFIIAIGISFFCLACPMMIYDGVKTIITEKSKADMQILQDAPDCFDRKKVLISYGKLFLLFGLLPMIAFLLPEGLWILVFPPLTVIDLAVLKLTEHTWIAFGWKKRSYWLLNGLIAGFVFLLILICRFGIIKR